MTRPAVLQILMTNGDLTADEAEKVFTVYRRVKALKFNAHDGYSITHGGFFDRDTIRRALNRAGAHA